MTNMRCGIRVWQSCGMEGQLGMREDKKIFWILRLRVARRDRSTLYKNITSWCHVKGFKGLYLKVKTHISFRNFLQDKVKLEWNKGLFSVLILKWCWMSTGFFGYYWSKSNIILEGSRHPNFMNPFENGTSSHYKSFPKRIELHLTPRYLRGILDMLK